MHGNRGRAPVNRTEAALRARIVELATEKYEGANRAHLAELLEEREHITIPEPSGLFQQIRDATARGLGTTRLRHGNHSPTRLM